MSNDLHLPLDHERTELARCCHRIAEAGLVVGSAGNLSVRSGDLVAVTPRRMKLGDIEPDACPVLDMDGSVVAGSTIPTSESQLHLAIYGRTDARAIVHTHSTYCAVLSTVLDEIPAIHYAVVQLGGPVRVAKYATFGTQELADHACEALEGRRAVLLQNHGAVVLGDDLDQALDRALLVEWLAEVYFRARTFGSPRILTEQELVLVQERAQFVGYWRATNENSASPDGPGSNAADKR